MTSCKNLIKHLYVGFLVVLESLAKEDNRWLNIKHKTGSLDNGIPEFGIPVFSRVWNSRVICNTSRYEHISPSLYNLHWLPVSYRIQFKILLLVYKTLNGLAPLYLSELIELKKPGRYNL